MSLLTLCQDALRALGEYEVPSAIITATNNDTAVKLLAIAKHSLAFNANIYAWQRLTAEYTFPTVASDGEYDLPSDFDWIVNDSVWDRTNRRKFGGPIAPQDWQALQASQVTSQFDPLFRIRGNSFLVYPTPSTVRTIAYEYQKNTHCQSSDGATAKVTFTADADVPRVPEFLLQLDIAWRWRKAAALPYDTELDEYVNYLQRITARDGGKAKISMSRSSLRSHILGEPNIPETFG